ncbi:MAG: hypothetical protein ACJAZQ_001998 [Cognaticolwellia sp.]
MASDFENLLQQMDIKNSDFLSQADKKLTGEYPTFEKNIKTEFLVFKENRYQNIIEPMMRKTAHLKLVAIIRNPNAVINSWLQSDKDFPEWAIPRKEWRYGACKNIGGEDFYGYYKWKEVSNIYLDLKEKWPERVCVVHYEELTSKPEKITKMLFEFCSIPYERQTIDFLKSSTTQHIDSPYSVFKNASVIDKWQHELDPYISNEIIQDLTGTRLEKFI